MCVCKHVCAGTEHVAQGMIYLSDKEVLDEFIQHSKLADSIFIMDPI